MTNEELKKENSVLKQDIDNLKLRLSEFELGNVDVQGESCSISKTVFCDMCKHYEDYLKCQERLEDTGIIIPEEVYSSILMVVDCLAYPCLGELGYERFLSFLHGGEEDTVFFNERGVYDVDTLYDFILKEQGK